jgi:hypothetical protein
MIDEGTRIYLESITRSSQEFYRHMAATYEPPKRHWSFVEIFVVAYLAITTVVLFVIAAIQFWWL